VMNSVTSAAVHIDSHLLFNEACEELGLTQEPPMRIIINDNNPISILKCRR
jgi:precorrin-6Y C5,15-methyltransferase (decarboxylating)